MISKLDAEIIKLRIVKRSVYRTKHSQIIIRKNCLGLFLFISILDSVLNDLQACFSVDIFNSFDLRVDT